MSSRSINLADAIVEKLNDPANDFIVKFKAVRRLAPFANVELDELKELNVLVFVGSKRTGDPAKRGDGKVKFFKFYKPLVAIQRRLDGLDEQSRSAHADQLIELVEQIEELLEGVSFTDMSFESFATEDREPFNAGAMQGVSFFSTAIEIEYQRKTL